MRDATRSFASIACALSLFLFAPVSSRAQSVFDADARADMAYTLTEAGLAKYVQATRNLIGLEIDDCDDESEVRTIAQAAAKLEATPGAKAAIQSAGMTTREYTVFAYSLIQNGMAAWTADQKGGQLPPGISQANVDFYRKHAAEMEKLGAELEDSNCDEEESTPG